MTESPNVLVTIDVTEDDISTGQCHSPTCCAIALAARRVFATKVSVGTQFLRIQNVHGDTLDRILHNQTKFVRAFDLYKINVLKNPRPSPISFQIEVPKEYVKCS